MKSEEEEEKREKKKGSVQIFTSSFHFLVPSMFMPKKHFFVAPSI